jgi:hypothetical protein
MTLHRITCALVAVVFCATLHAEEDEPELLFACIPNSSRVVLSTDTSPRSRGELENKKIYPVFEEIKIHGLILRNEGREGRTSRVGSTTLQKKCGELTISIQGGYLNSNPDGELGATEYPLVEATFRGKQLLQKTSLGYCSTTFGRYNYMTQCPNDWATEVTLITDGSSKPFVVLRHAYEEYRYGP